MGSPGGMMIGVWGGAVKRLRGGKDFRLGLRSDDLHEHQQDDQDRRDDEITAADTPKTSPEARHRTSQPLPSANGAAEAQATAILVPTRQSVGDSPTPDMGSGVHRYQEPWASNAGWPLEQLNRGRPIRQRRNRIVGSQPNIALVPELSNKDLKGSISDSDPPRKGTAG